MDIEQKLDSNGVEQLEIVAQGRDKDGEEIDRAIREVRKFISQRQLVLYGGLAIDYALRMEGGRIYPDEERPDFDVLSPTNVKDAYDLAELLHAQGFTRVGAIRAIHVQTMRVRVNFIPVADISFVPESVNKLLPTLQYGGEHPITVLHPHWQHMDQHLAFCFPFSNPPREDLYHRFAKDLKRYNLLSEKYPMPAPKPVKPPKGTREVAHDPQCEALHGFAAHAVLRAALAAMKNGKELEVDLTRLPDREVDIVTTRHMEPTHRPFLDLSMPTRVEKGVTYHLLAHRQLATVLVTPQVRIVSTQYLLLYFLLGWHREKDKNLYLWHYVDTLKMLQEADEFFATLEAPEDLIASSPFGLSVSVLGDHNISEAQLIIMANDAKWSKIEPPEFLTLPDLAAVPMNYHIGSGKSRPADFDPSASPLFMMDGGKLR